MFYIIVAVIVGLIVLIAAIVGLVSKDPDTKAPAFGTALIAGVVLALFTLFMSLTTVDARAVAIQTSFGKYTNTLGPGLQFIAPWSSTEEFTTRLQDVDLNSKDNDGKNAVYVSFSAPRLDSQNEKAVAGGGNGWINAVVRYQINPDQGATQGAKLLWEKFRTFEDVKNRLVTSEAQQSVMDIANNFPAGDAVVNQGDIGNQVKTDLSNRLARYGIIVDSVAIKGIDLDDPTKASLQRIVDNINKTKAAEEEQKRAKIDNETAKLRAAAGALDEKANERYCLDVVNNWDVTKNGPLPATFNCGLGGTPPVLVGAGK